MKARLALAAAAMTIAANPAQATTTVAYSFNTTGNTADNGTYGNAMVFGTANKPSTLQMSVTAWQANATNGAISSAYLGAYGGGLGITGIGDANGANGLHQVDSTGGYIDFLLLEFNQAVTLASIKTNSYAMNGVSGVANDAATWFDLSGFATSAWNSTAGFATSGALPTSGGAVADANSFGWRLTGATTASTKWVVAASPFTFNDGFKLSSVTVAEQVASVPEPATWATMILGFGVAGAALRRGRRRTTKVAFA